MKCFKAVTTDNKIIYLDPNDIHTDDRLQVRSKRSIKVDERDAVDKRLEDTRKRLFKVINAGEHVDPIEVFDNDGEWLVFDGHNRLAVYQKVRRKRDIKIPVKILPYSYQEALAKGYTVNTKHGVGLTEREASQAAFRSCVYSENEIPTNDLVQQGIGIRTAQMIKKAAKMLRDEAVIAIGDSPDQIASKVSRWCSDMLKKGYAPAGSNRIHTDDHGFPRYRFVIEKKPVKEPNEGYLIEHMAQTLEKLVGQDSDIFLRALKRISHKSRLGLPVTVKTNKKRNVKVDEDDDWDF